MPWMSEIPVDSRRRDVMRLANNTYRMHALVMKACDNSSAKDDGRILWHVDRRPSGEIFLYVVSPERPDLQVLEESLCTAGMGAETRTRSYDRLLSSLHKGQHLRFRLVANPVFQVTRDDNANASQSLAHVTIQQQMAWLAGTKLFGKGITHVDGLRGSGIARDECNGFKIIRTDGVLQFQITHRETVRFKKRPDGKPITISKAIYEGICEVTDVDKLRHALTCGIGRSKGFGCGLLMVYPID